MGSPDQVWATAVRVPLLVRCPGQIEPGTVRDESDEWIDLTQTLLAAAGPARLPRAQGRDLAPLWFDGPWEKRD